MTQLSDRQNEIAVLTERGFSRREIGDMLGISSHTVRNHVTRAAKKRPDLAKSWRAGNLAQDGARRKQTQAESN